MRSFIVGAVACVVAAIITVALHVNPWVPVAAVVFAVSGLADLSRGTGSDDLIPPWAPFFAGAIVAYGCSLIVTLLAATIVTVTRRTAKGLHESAT
jgi:hypothetical protein